MTEKNLPAPKYTPGQYVYWKNNHGHSGGGVIRKSCCGYWGGGDTLVWGYAVGRDDCWVTEDCVYKVYVAEGPVARAAVTPPPRNPMQPFVLDGTVVRFKRNAVVRYLLDNGGLTLNDLAVVEFPQDDQCQFAQLIGYSLSGYHELGYVSDEHAREASVKAREQFPDCGGCRDDGCEIHVGVPREE